VLVPLTVRLPEMVTLLAVRPVATSRLIALSVVAFTVPEKFGEFETAISRYPPASS